MRVKQSLLFDDAYTISGMDGHLFLDTAKYDVVMKSMKVKRRVFRSKWQQDTVYIELKRYKNLMSEKPNKLYEIHTYDGNKKYCDNQELEYYQKDANVLVIKTVTSCHQCGADTKLLKVSGNIPRCESCIEEYKEHQLKSLSYGEEF